MNVNRRLYSQLDKLSSESEEEETDEYTSSPGSLSENADRSSSEALQGSSTSPHLDDDYDERVCSQCKREFTEKDNPDIVSCGKCHRNFHFRCSFYPLHPRSARALSQHALEIRGSRGGTHAIVRKAISKISVRQITDMAEYKHICANCLSSMNKKAQVDYRIMKNTYVTLAARLKDSFLQQTSGAVKAERVKAERGNTSNSSSATREATSSDLGSRHDSSSGYRQPSNNSDSESGYQPDILSAHDSESGDYVPQPASKAYGLSSSKPRGSAFVPSRFPNRAMAGSFAAEENYTDTDLLGNIFYAPRTQAHREDKSLFIALCRPELQVRMLASKVFNHLTPERLEYLESGLSEPVASRSPPASEPLKCTARRPRAIGSACQFSFLNSQLYGARLQNDETIAKNAKASANIELQAYNRRMLAFMRVVTSQTLRDKRAAELQENIAQLLSVFDANKNSNELVLQFDKVPIQRIRQEHCRTDREIQAHFYIPNITSLDLVRNALDERVSGLQNVPPGVREKLVKANSACKWYLDSSGAFYSLVDREMSQRSPEYGRQEELVIEETRAELTRLSTASLYRESLLTIEPTIAPPQREDPQLHFAYDLLNFLSDIRTLRKHSYDRSSLSAEPLLLDYHESVFLRNTKLERLMMLYEKLASDRRAGLQEPPKEKENTAFK